MPDSLIEGPEVRGVHLRLPSLCAIEDLPQWLYSLLGANGMWRESLRRVMWVTRRYHAMLAAFRSETFCLAAVPFP